MARLTKIYTRTGDTDDRSRRWQRVSKDSPGLGVGTGGRIESASASPGHSNEEETDAIWRI